MTPRESVSHWIDNYLGFLRNSLVYLEKAGIGVGSDDWDFFFEEMYRVFVVNRIEETFGFWVGRDYGTWTDYDGKEAATSIGVKVQAGTLILVGTTAGNRTTYRELVLESDWVFWFCEFRYPWTEGEDMETHLKHVGGVSATGDVCAPLEQCQFFVTLNAQAGSLEPSA